MKQRGRQLAIGLFVSSLASAVAAQTAEERAGSRAAAERGVQAFEEGRWADAADLMARAEKLVHAPTHLLYQAQAEEKQGHLVVANELYLRIIREKMPSNAPEVFLAAQKEAQTRADALRPRLSQISIVVQGSPAGAVVQVTMDEHRVPDALVGVPHPVDPGEHRLEATAEGMRSSLSKIVLREGASETVVLTLQKDPNSPSPGAATAPRSTESAPVTAGTQTTSTATSTSNSSGMHPLKLGGYIGLGVGVIGLGVGTVFAIRSSGLRGDADDLCNPDGTCPVANRPRIEELDGDANTAKAIAVTGFVVGGVGVAAGVTMLLLAPSKTTLPQKAFIAPYFAGQSAGLYGRF